MLQNWFIYFYLCVYLKTNAMNTENATIKFNGSKTYTVVDTTGQCLLATTSELKAKNFLKRLFKNS